MKQKMISAVLCAAMAVSLLSGCGDNTKETTAKETASKETKVQETTQETEATQETSEKKETSAASGEAVEVTAMMMQSRHTDGLKNMIDKLEVEENIIIDLQVIPDDQYDNLLKMRFGAGEAPDMIDYNMGQLDGHIDVPAHLVDLSEEAWVDKLVLPENSISDDGKHYGFPFAAMYGFNGMVYNVDVFKKAGVEVPTTPEEFAQVCQKIKDAGITPILLPADSWVPQIWMTTGFARAMGDDEKSKEMSDKIFSNQAKLTDYPQLAKAIDSYIELEKKGYYNEDYLTLTYDSCLDKLGKGEAAMMMAGSWVPDLISVSAPDTNMGMFNVPVSYDEKDNLVIAPASPGFYLNKESENQEAVKKIFDLWSTPEYANLYFEKAPGYPAFEGVDGGNVDAESQELWKKHLENKTLVNEMNVSWGPIDSLMGPYLWVYYQEVLSKGEMDGMGVLERFQGDIETFMKSEGAEGF